MPLSAMRLATSTYGLFVEWPANGAVHVEALGDREAQLARHQGGRLDDVDVVLVEAAFVGDLDHVAEAVGGDQGVFEPLRSMMALVASVVPCTNRPMSANARPAALSAPLRDRR
jgi:hypothetical protein